MRWIRNGFIGIETCAVVQESTERPKDKGIITDLFTTATVLFQPICFSTETELLDVSHVRRCVGSRGERLAWAASFTAEQWTEAAKGMLSHIRCRELDMEEMNVAPKSLGRNCVDWEQFLLAPVLFELKTWG